MPIIKIYLQMQIFPKYDDSVQERSPKWYLKYPAFMEMVCSSHKRSARNAQSSMYSLAWAFTVRTLVE